MTEIQSDIDRYRRLLEKDPDSRVFAPLAEACRKEGRLQEALEIAREGVSRHPTYASGRVALARVLLALEDFVEAAGELESAIEAAPDNALAFRLLGEAKGRLGDREGSFEAYARALALNPEDEEARREIEGLGTPVVTEEDSPDEAATGLSAGTDEAAAGAGEDLVADAVAPPTAAAPDGPETAGAEEEIPCSEPEGALVPPWEEPVEEAPVPADRAVAEAPVEAADSDWEPADAERELGDADREPADTDWEPADAEREPIDGDQALVDAGREPADGDRALVDAGREPADGDQALVDAGREPADGDQALVDAEREPAELDLELEPLEDAPAELETLPSGPSVISDPDAAGAEALAASSDTEFWSEEAFEEGDRSGPGADVWPEAEADKEPWETPPEEASPAFDLPAAPPSPATVPRVEEETAGLESPEEASAAFDLPAAPSSAAIAPRVEEETAGLESPEEASAAFDLPTAPPSPATVPRVEEETAGLASPEEASPAFDLPAAPSSAAIAPRVEEETAGLESPGEVPGGLAEAVPDGEETSQEFLDRTDEGLETIDTIQSSLAPEADEWSAAPPAAEDLGASPQALEASAEKPEEAPPETSADEEKGLDTRAEEVADQLVERGQADHGRAIYRSILAHDPLNLRVRKKLLDLGQELAPPPGVTVPGDPAVRQKVEENIETLNRWLANVKKGANR
jgi:tetratricopeptide (TPR) repeat protein